MPASGSRQSAVVRIFGSFEEENASEHDRLAALSPTERLNQFAILQQRVFGEKWVSEPMVKTASYETVDW